MRKTIIRWCIEGNVKQQYKNKNKIKANINKNNLI